ncbi:MAG: DUF4346 domain-containing protein, partial [Candidatus Methylomirabilis sp.]|nr:DUF4346 domain-containing protein [Deltaproteobacteria bacterium]
SYTVLRYRAPVAVCTLNDGELADALAALAPPELAIVGAMHTENLGIERVILNVLGNPHIRFLILCGADSEQAIGHLPGQSLLALAASGLDERGRIVGARGRRPLLKNLAPDAVEHFRRHVEAIDRIGRTDPTEILDAAWACAARDPGAAPVFPSARALQPIIGYLPARMVPDPEGYFVVYADRARRALVLEHYRKDGVLDALLEGRSAAELYTPTIERGLLSRLDHAAYLGRELARAEHALAESVPYVQDGAPEAPGAAERSGFGCSSTCSDVES